MIKQEFQKSTKSKDDKETLNNALQLQMINFRNSQAKIIFQEDHQQIQAFNSKQTGQIKIKVSQVNQNQTSGNELKNSLISFKNKDQYQQSIKMSYLVLQNAQQMPSQRRKKQRIHKKSFGAPATQQEKKINNFDNAEKEKQLQKIKQAIQVLKKPLKIDIKKLDPRQCLYNQLSQNLQHFNGKIWEKCSFDFDLKSQQLVLSSVHIALMSIDKIKLYKPNFQKCLNELKITFSGVQSQETLFLNKKTQNYINKIPSQYLIFSQVLTQRLKIQNKFKQTKWDKKQHIIENLIIGSYIFGQIYKKSQHFGRWQKRYIILNSKGVFSYKSHKIKQEHSFSIQRNSIQYLWSRFDVIDGYLVIKIKHGLKQTQFGIPICNFNSIHYKNWLYYFYRLIMPN